MSADRVDRTRAVTTPLTKCDPTKGKSVRERLGKIRQVGFKEDRNIGGPTRSDTGRHNRSSKTRADKPESVHERLKNIYGRWVSERVEMSADRHDRTRAVTTRLAKRHPTNRKSVRERLRKIQVERYEGG